MLCWCMHFSYTLKNNWSVFLGQSKLSNKVWDTAESARCPVCQEGSHSLQHEKEPTTSYILIRCIYCSFCPTPPCPSTCLRSPWNGKWGMQQVLFNRYRLPQEHLLSCPSPPLLPPSSQNHTISQVGRDPQDHQVQPPAPRRTTISAALLWTL